MAFHIQRELADPMARYCSLLDAVNTSARAGQGRLAFVEAIIRRARRWFARAA